MRRIRRWRVRRCAVNRTAYKMRALPIRKDLYLLHYQACSPGVKSVVIQECVLFGGRVLSGGYTNRRCIVRGQPNL